MSESYRSVKKVLKKDHLAGTYYVSLYQYIPYMGCGHGCKYCDGRCEKYYFEGDFEKDIVMREKCYELLDQELTKARAPGNVMLSSGMSDAYQPIEAKYQLTRKSLEVLLAHKKPVSILTKSGLVERDFDLLEEINKVSHVCLMFSFSGIKEEVRRTFEPKAATYQKRLSLMKKAKDLGFSVGVSALPILPRISDKTDELEALTTALVQAGADFIMPGGLTLRPGRQKDLYFETLKSFDPSLLKEVDHIYRYNRQSGGPDDPIHDGQINKFAQLILSQGIPLMQPDHITKKLLPLAQRVHVLLHHMAYLYHDRGVKVDGLKKDIKDYDLWLTEQMKYCARSKKRSYGDIDEALYEDLAKEAYQIIRNKKLSHFLKNLLEHDLVFNYQTLQEMELP